MPITARPTPNRHPRPSSPRCRGGASSLLRLAPALPVPAMSWFAPSAFGAMARNARRPLLPETEAVFDSSIITRLLPSHELLGR